MNPYMTERPERSRSLEKRFIMLAFRRMYLGFVFTVSAFCALTLIMPDISRADWSVTPTFLVEEQYSDNWFRAEEGEDTFWVTRISPGLSLRYATSRSQLSLDGSYSYSWHYSPSNDANASDEDYSGADVSLYAAYQPTTRVTLDLRNNFTRTREPASTDQFSQSTDRNLYWRNTVTPSILYDIAEKGQIRLAYQGDVLMWESSDPGQGDSKEHQGTLTLTYNLNSTNHLDLESHVARRSYDAGLSDYYRYQSKLIFRHEFNTYFSGRVGAGHQHRDYDESDLDDSDEPVFDAGLTGATDRTKIDLSAERNLVNFTTEDDYFTALRVNLSLQRIFQEVIRTYAGGYYQRSNHIESPRRDHTYNGFVGVGYRFFRKMFEVSLEYSYTNRDSNETGRDYVENQVFLRLNMSYDNFLDLFQKE